MRLLLPVVLFAVTVLDGPVWAGPPAPTAAPVEPLATGVDEGRWFRILLDGSPAGYEHHQATVDDSGLVATWTLEEFRLARMGQTVSMAVEITVVERSDGTIERIALTSRMPGETRWEGRVEDAELHVTETGATGAREFVEPWPTDCLGPAYWERRLTRWLPEADVGEQLATITFEPMLGGRTVTTHTVRERQGGEVEVEAEADRVPGITERVRYDARGRTLRRAVTMLGLEVVSEAADRELALAALGAGGPAPEAFASTVLRPDLPLPRPRSLDRVVLRLRRKDPAIPLPDFASARQRVLAVEPRGVLLEIHRVDPGDPPRSAEGERSRATEVAPPTAAEREPNGTIQSDDPAVIRLARELAGDAVEPWEVARRLERGVYEYIDKKSFGVAFASASEVCRDRSGDCSEHAVLLAALCRARGLPARVAMGLTYLGGIFGGHAWTEVWIDDGWYALDGTNGLGSVDATHIRFTASALRGLGMGAAMYGSLLGLANLEIEVVELEADGRSLRAGEMDSAAFTVEGDVLHSHVHGVRLSAPEGYSWEDEAPAWSTGLVARARGPGGSELRVRARAVGYAFDPQALRAGATVAIDVEVQGRPGVVCERDGWALQVLDGDTVLRVSTSAGAAGDDDEALDLLLALARTIAFDR